MKAMKAMKVLKVINVIDFCQNRFGFSSTHSELAMTAAKKMRRTKSKEKTGHKVCRHLLDMLAEERTSEAFHSNVDVCANVNAFCLEESSIKESSIKEGSTKEDNFWFGMSASNLFNKESSRQISLSF